MLIVWIGLVVGNFAWQFFNEKVYEIALERSYFQALALGSYYFYLKFMRGS